MTTPENPDRPAWGQPPAGGWGAQPGDAADETRSWSEQGAPEEPDGATTRIDRPAPDGSATRIDRPVPDGSATRLEQPGAWNGAPAWGAQPGGRQWGPPPPNLQARPNPQAPAWAQQPPPGGGWGPPAPQPGHRPAPGYPPASGRYPPGPQQWGPQAYPPLPGPPSGRPRRSRVPFVVAGVVVLAVALFLILGLVTPGFLNTTVFDRTQLQAGVQRVLTDSYQITGVGEVTCGDPADGPITVRVDDTFTCTTMIDGAPASIPVRITSSDGGYEVSRPA